MGALYVALLHGEVVDKIGQEIASSLTHFDVHDIARSCRSYGVRQYYVVTPLESMRYLASRMLSYWQSGIGNFTIPNRGEALEVVRVATDLAEVTSLIEQAHGCPPRIMATSARRRENSLDCLEARKMILEEPQPNLILFGTAYGICNRVMEKCDYILPPIRSGRWNHLSVRSAVAITLDRLVGEENIE